MKKLIVFLYIVISFGFAIPFASADTSTDQDNNEVHWSISASYRSPYHGEKVTEMFQAYFAAEGNRFSCYYQLDDFEHRYKSGQNWLIVGADIMGSSVIETSGNNWVDVKNNTSGAKICLHKFPGACPFVIISTDEKSFFSSKKKTQAECLSVEKVTQILKPE